MFEAIKRALPEASQRHPAQVLQFVLDAIRGANGKLIEGWVCWEADCRQSEMRNLLGFSRSRLFGLTGGGVMVGVIWPAEADTGNWDPTVERIGLSKVIARELERVRAITAHIAPYAVCRRRVRHACPEPRGLGIGRSNKAPGFRRRAASQHLLPALPCPFNRCSKVHLGMAMFKDYWKYEWVLPVYRCEAPLLATLAGRSSPLQKGRCKPWQSDGA